MRENKRACCHLDNVSFINPKWRPDFGDESREVTSIESCSLVLWPLYDQQKLNYEFCVHLVYQGKKDVL